MFNRHSLSYLLLVVGGLTWGCTPLLITLASVEPMPLVWFRSLFTLLFLFLFSAQELPKHYSELKKDIRKQVVAAIFSVASTSAFAAACLLTTAENVYFLFYLFPMYGLVFSSIREKIWPSGRDCALVAISLLGLLLFVTDKISLSGVSLGEAIAAISGLFWAAYMFQSSTLRSKKQGLNATILGQVFGVFIFAPFAFYSMATSHIPLPGWSQISWLILFGFTSSMPLFAYGWALSAGKVKPHIAGIISLIEAPVGVLLIWFFFGTTVSATSILGGSLILLTAALVSLGPKEN